MLAVTQAQKIVVWKLSVSLQNLRWNFIFILLRLLFSKNFGFCCLTFLRGRSWLVKRFTPHGQPNNQRCPLKQAEIFAEHSIMFWRVTSQNQNNGDNVNKIEGKNSKSFSTLLEIARKGQLFIENTVTK